MSPFRAFMRVLRRRFVISFSLGFLVNTHGLRQSHGWDRQISFKMARVMLREVGSQPQCVGLFLTRHYIKLRGRHFGAFPGG